MKIRRLLLVLILMLCYSTMTAQEQTPQGWTLQTYAAYDYHYATGSVGAWAIMGEYQLYEPVTLRLGMEAATKNRYAVDLRCRVNLHRFEKGTLYAENRYLYRQFPSIDRQEFTGALQIGWSNIHWNFEMGLCNRYQADRIQRSNGGKSTQLEPMNVMFAIEGNLFGQEHNWNIGGRWSNYNDFIIERVSLWYYSLKGYYQLKDGLRLTAEAGIHPVGSLNLTSSYDGGFCHLGAAWQF